MGIIKANHRFSSLVMTLLDDRTTAGADGATGSSGSSGNVVPTSGATGVLDSGAGGDGATGAISTENAMDATDAMDSMDSADDNNAALKENTDNNASAYRATGIANLSPLGSVEQSAQRICKDHQV